MGSLKDWFKKQAISLAMAVSNTEKNLLSQDGRSLGEVTKQERRHTQGTLADSLVHGEITQEVKDLRWRTYKVLKAMDGIKIKYKRGADGFPTLDYEVSVADPKDMLKTVKADETDPYEIELVVDNAKITIGLEDGAGGDMSSGDYNMLKNEQPVKVTRNFFPKFYLERFTKRLIVRKINDTQRLLEFYVSKYPDEYNRTSEFFLVEIKKVLNGDVTRNFLTFDEVGFITYKTLGVNDFLSYGYKVVNFDKIIEYDGNYVLKFIADVTINGVDILSEYVEPELEKKYKDKAPRKKKK